MSEVRQRWRLVFARDEDARYLSHLDAVRSWERAFRRGDIPVATSEGFSPRPRLVFAAPLQLGMLAERELADLYLSTRLSSSDLRDRLQAGMPRGYRLVDLHDVWIGEPALAPQLAAADYRLTLFNVEQADLAAAIERVLAAEKLSRVRHREHRTIAYDLRPLILDLAAANPDTAAIAPEGHTDGGPAAVGLRMRLRHAQEGGSGRPEEVVGALADELGMTTRPAPTEEGEAAVGASVPAASGASVPADSGAAGTAPAAPPARPLLEAVRTVRERLWLAADLATAGEK